ncbi:hypothetical protein AAC387_Pa08g1164 [Persea americana]
MSIFVFFSRFLLLRLFFFVRLGFFSSLDFSSASSLAFGILKQEREWRKNKRNEGDGLREEGVRDPQNEMKNLENGNERMRLEKWWRSQMAQGERGRGNYRAQGTFVKTKGAMKFFEKRFLRSDEGRIFSLELL